MLEGAVAKILASTAAAPFALARALFEVEDSQKLSPVALEIGARNDVTKPVVTMQGVRDILAIVACKKYIV
ncbi:hypothetical protein AND4_07334 [Vibrio sp. AND4]|uniref:hypothetical protein n=1 Tax=Vibrio sp. AND4 TaxID=314289 RepID=UPI00015F3001|nr:hypothetical protein AND4_07334 [Vibrio sp. AND4]